MLATKNRAGGGVGLILAIAVLVTACSPPGPRALLKGKKLLDAGNYAQAAEALKNATSLMPTNAVAWNYLGLAYHRAGQGTNAAAAYTRALALNRELSEARFNLGCLWLEQDNLEAAKSEFTAYTMRRGNAPEGWLKLGLAQLRATNSLAAEKSFRAAINLNPQSAEAFNALGLAQRQRGRAAEAAQSFKAALKQQSNYGPALLNLATVAQQDLNDRPEALRRYREYLALQPRAADWDAVNTLVQSLAPPPLPQAIPGTNGIARVVAVPNVTRPPAVASNRSITQPKPGATATVSKPPPPAPLVAAPPPPTPVEIVQLPPEPVVKSVLESPRDNRLTNPVTTATNTAAVPVIKAPRRGVFSRLNPLNRETKTARIEAAPMIAAPIVSAPAPTPDGPAAAGGRYVYQLPAVPPAGDRPAAERALLAGKQAQNLGRSAEAIQAYRRAGQLDGSYFEAHYLLGLAAFEARSFRLALSAWETALALRPDSAEARYNFALTLKASNYPHAAADELEKLLALHPDEARGHLTLGNLYAEQLHDIPRARRHHGRVLQLDPRNPQAQAIRYWLVANPG